MVRRTQYASEAALRSLDAIDRALLSAVAAGLSGRALFHSVTCHPEEAEGRILRLLHLGFLTGTPDDISCAVPHEPQVPEPSPLEALLALPDPELILPPHGVSRVPAPSQALLDGGDPDLGLTPWDDDLPYPVPETPPPSMPDHDGSQAREVLFAADPPSTLQSLLKRGPPKVAIQTRGPSRRSGQGSNVFRRLDRLDFDAIDLARQAEAGGHKRK